MDRDPAAIAEGELLAGKYRIERVLGTGGMGVVVAARHVQLGQLVAIKFLKPEALNQPGAFERFLRESRAVASLRSEHVSRVLDIGTLESGAPYMVMEFLDGRDLGAVLNDQGPLAVDLAAHLVHQACKALAEAHTNGIVHRDLKPQNLFLTHTLQGSPRLKVLDFGISKWDSLHEGGRAGLTQTRAMMGSPLYMAPEQMRSARKVDPRSDVWALGVVLFELLTQRWPFEADDLPELCLKVVSDAPLSIAELRPDVPRALVRVVERCLEKDPAYRFQTAMDLAFALEPFARALELSGVDSDPTVLTESPFHSEREYVHTRVSRSDPSDLSMSASLLPSADASARSAAADVSAASPQTPASWGTPARKRSKARRPVPRLLLALGAVALLLALVLGIRRSAEVSSVAPLPSLMAPRGSTPLQAVSSVEAAASTIPAPDHAASSPSVAHSGSAAPGPSAIKLSAKPNPAVALPREPRLPISNPALPKPIASAWTAPKRPVVSVPPPVPTRAPLPARSSDNLDLEIRSKR